MAMLIVISGDERLEFELGAFNTLGRHPDNTFQILDRIISKEHAQIQRSGDGRYLLRDLRSLNGVDDESPGSNGWLTAGQRVRAKRQKQAESLANLVQARQVADPTESIVLVGDFNAFEFNDGLVDSMGTIVGMPTPAPEVVLASPDLVTPNLLNLLPTVEAERYSFSFDGNAQTLDHVLLSSVASAVLSGFGHAHIDADFPEVLRGDPGRPERLSDHDPAVARFTFPEAPGAIIGTGQISDPSRVIFRFFAQQTPEGDEQGWLTLIAPRRNARPNTLVVAGLESVVFAGPSVQFSGTGWWNGSPGYTFVAESADNGKPGVGLDTFSVTVRDPQAVVVLEASGVLSGGNVENLP